MKHILVALALLAAVGPAAAQVGVIIQSPQPAQAQALARRARQIHQSVSAQLSKGSASAAGKRKLHALALELREASARIRADAKAGAPMSLGEEDQVEKGLKVAMQVSDWLEAKATGKAPPSPQPSPR